MQQSAFQLLHDENCHNLSYNTILHLRHSIHLQSYDYSQPGGYFITVCTQNHKPWFGEIFNGEMHLNELGEITQNQLLRIPTRFEHIELDEFVIMPNHIHAIIIHEPVGAGFTPAQYDDLAYTRVGVGVGLAPTHMTLPINHPETGQPQGLPLRKTLGNIIGAYKSLVANECLKIFKTKNQIMAKFWQRNYYEHIIRDEKSYQQIAQYIIDNPAHWELDSLYPRDKL